MTSNRKTIFWALIGPVIWIALFLSVWSGEADGAPTTGGFAPLTAREIAATAALEAARLEASVTGCLAATETDAATDAASDRAAPDPGVDGRWND